jgi:hypothetical protein
MNEYMFLCMYISKYMRHICIYTYIYIYVCVCVFAKEESWNFPWTKALRHWEVRGHGGTSRHEWMWVVSLILRPFILGKEPPAAIGFEAWLPLQPFWTCLFYYVKKSKAVPLHAMEGEKAQLLLILNLGTRWGWVVSVTPRPRFTPFGTHWIRGWVGPRAGPDAAARRKILCPCRGSNPDRPARSQTLYCLSYRGSILICIM